MTYPQYPGSGGYPMQYPGAEPRPSGGTAITAGVLAVLGGVWHLISLIGLAIVVSNVSVSVFIIVSLLVNLILVGSLLAGGILLFMKKPAGRLLTIIGAGLAVLFYVGSMIVALVGTSSLTASNGTKIDSGGLAAVSGAAVLIFSIPAIATLVLAIVKPTERYVNQTPAAYGTPPGGYQQQPGYPQQQPGFPQSGGFPQQQPPGYPQQQQQQFPPQPPYQQGGTPPQGW